MLRITPARGGDFLHSTHKICRSSVLLDASLIPNYQIRPVTNLSYGQFTAPEVSHLSWRYQLLYFLVYPSCVPPRPRHCKQSVDCYYIDAEDIDGREGAWSVHRESWADHRELPGPLIDHHHADRYRIIGVLFRHDLPGIDDKSSGIKGA